MATVTKAEFARLHEVSKPAVQKWERQGYLVMIDGKVDVEQSDVLLADASLGKFGRKVHDDLLTAAAEAIRAAPRMEPQGHGGALKRNKSAPEPPVDPAMATVADFLHGLLNGNYASQATAERVKENALAGLRALEMRKKAGDLIEIETAERTLFDIFRSVRDGWLNWPVRVGPLIAAELNVEADRVTELLNEHVNRHLADLGEPDADFAAGE